MRYRSAVSASIGLLLCATVWSACGETSNPVSPTSEALAAKVKPLALPLLTETTFWDFAGIIPGTNDPEDLGTTETISISSNPGAGFIAASTSGAGEHIVVKGRSLPIGDSERGLGLCHTTESTCTFPTIPDIGGDGDEVGDGGPGTLKLDFGGVQAGSVLKSIELGSLQTNEGYRYSISTNGGVSFGPTTDVYPNTADPRATLVVDLPTTNLVVKLEKAADIAANANDYTVRSVYTELSTTELEGRLTGGGLKVAGTRGEVVTFGMTLHCDILLSNNLEVNWSGHKWHLTKPITSASCDNIQQDPEPPASPIDTFEGEGYGKLDGVGNSFVRFRFEDHGEPGSNDRVQITIYEPGSTTLVALDIALQKINVGNLQMHYDQPHGQKP